MLAGSGCKFKTGQLKDIIRRCFEFKFTDFKKLVPTYTQREKEQYTQIIFLHDLIPFKM